MALVKLPNNPDNYMMPSALSIWFAPFDDDGTLCPWFDLGNAASIALTLADEYLTHESARNGLLTEDKHVVNKVTGDIKFTLDELVGNNLVLLFRPNIAPDAASTYEVLEQKRIRLVGTTAEIIDALAIEDGSLDYVDLYWEDDTVDDVLVRSTDGSVTYVEGVDYTFTQAAGTGTGRTPATIARMSSGAIVDGAEVIITYNYVRETTEYRIQTGAVLEGAMKIQALNRIGPLFAYQFPFVSIGIEGDTTIDPAAFMSQSFSCKILADGTGNRGSFHLFDNFEKVSTGIEC